MLVFNNYTSRVYCEKVVLVFIYCLFFSLNIRYGFNNVLYKKSLINFSKQVFQTNLFYP